MPHRPNDSHGLIGPSPKGFPGFIGQGEITAYLARIVLAAKTKGRTCPHLLLLGATGCGKTTLAHCVAKVYGTKLFVLPAGRDLRVVDVSRTFAELEYADFVFLDEAHAATPDVQECLFTGLDRWKMPGVSGRQVDRTKLDSVAEFWFS